MIYWQVGEELAEELLKDHQEYISKVAKTEKDACNLIDAGFGYVCDFNDAKIFRKSKYLRLRRGLKPG